MIWAFPPPVEAGAGLSRAALRSGPATRAHGLAAVAKPLQSLTWVGWLPEHGLGTRDTRAPALGMVVT